MNNCTLSENDCFWLYLRDDQETIEIFGEDYLNDFGLQLPNELIEEYKQAFKQWQLVQNKLETFFNR